MTVPSLLRNACWELSALPEAIRALADQAGIQPEKAEISLPQVPVGVDDAWLSQWLGVASSCLKIQIVDVEARYHELSQFLRTAGPALVRIGTGPTAGILAIVRGGARAVSVVTPWGGVRRIPAASVRGALARPLERAAAGPIEDMLRDAGVAEAQREASVAAIMSEQLAEERVGGCWLLRMSPGAGLRDQVRRSRVPGYLITMMVAHVIGVVIMLASWAVIGSEGLAEHFDRVSLLAWALLLSTVIPFQLLELWAQNALAIELGGMFRQRLLHGILQLEPDEIQHQGAGQFLGVVMEAESLSSLALGGGLVALVALVELVVGLVILTVGAGGVIHAVLLAGWLAFTAWLCWSYYVDARDWVTVYRQLTSDLVERMTGYRTRLVQESPLRWHDEESEFLTAYLARSARLDRKGIAVRGLIVRGWMLLGVIGILVMMDGSLTLTSRVAIAIGGVLFVSQGLNSLVAGVMNMMNAAVAWQQVGPLFDAASRSQVRPAGLRLLPTALEQAIGSESVPLIASDELTFTYRGNRAPALRACSLDIYSGDRVLLQGPSGGGKSTLTAVLSGLRLPDAGDLRLGGLAQRDVGVELWRDRIATAPQFHENHILTETLAFNLLMGRGWPPQPQDIQDATEICYELGLGPLLKRMPSGMQQMVGDSGWQLSHGERSRVYIARALLQRADLLILDESFAALDPSNLQRAMECVLRRAPTILVVAHP